jgi:hypothetical protein
MELNLNRNNYQTWKRNGQDVQLGDMDNDYLEQCLETLERRITAKTKEIATAQVYIHTQTKLRTAIRSVIASRQIAEELQSAPVKQVITSKA